MPENNSKETENAQDKDKETIITPSYSDFEDDLEDDELDDDYEDGDFEDDEDDEDFEGEDFEDDEDEGEYSENDMQLQAQSMLDQLMSSPLFAQVQQMMGGLGGVDGMFSRAGMLQTQGDLDGAAHIYLDILDENAESYRANEELGKVLLAMDKPSEAEIYLKKAGEIEPENASAFLYLGYAYFYQEKYDECTQAFEKCVEIDPQNHIASNNLGYAYYLNGELEKAVTTFTKSGDAGSDRAYYNLGMVNLLLGKEKAATEAYQEAFDLDPRLRQIEDHISDLEKASEKYPERAELLQKQIETLREQA